MTQDLTATRRGFLSVSALSLFTLSDAKAAAQDDMELAPDLGRLAASSGSNLVGFLQSGGGAQARTVQDKLRDIASLRDFGAFSQVPDCTAQVAAAFSQAGTALHVNEGVYNVHNLEPTKVGLTIVGWGQAAFLRNADGPILSSAAADDINFTNVTFSGSFPAYRGDLLSFDADRGRLFGCAARRAGPTDFVLKIRGSRWLILGDRDTYDGNVKIVSPPGGPVSAYHNLVAMQVTGTLDLEDTGFVVATGCLLGGLSVTPGAGTAGGHGAKINSTRLVGDALIAQSGTCLSAGASMAGDLVIGDGGALDGMTIDPTFTMARGSTLTVREGVRGSFHIAHLLRAGIAVVIPDSVRQNSDVYHGMIPYGAAVAGDRGGFALGNGVLAAAFSQQGNLIFGKIELVIGSTTRLPSGALYLTLPVPIGGSPMQGLVDVTDAGVGTHQGLCRCYAGNTISSWFRTRDAADQPLSGTSPVALSPGDAIRWTFTYGL